MYLDWYEAESTTLRTAGWIDHSAVRTQYMTNYKRPKYLESSLAVHNLMYMVNQSEGLQTLKRLKSLKIPRKKTLKIRKNKKINIQRSLPSILTVRGSCRKEAIDRSTFINSDDAYSKQTNPPIYNSYILLHYLRIPFLLVPFHLIF